MSSRKLKISLVRSAIGLKPGHVRTLEALGLRRIRATVVHDDTPVIRGMIAQVSYAIEVTPVTGDGPTGRGTAAAGRSTKERSA